jgi:hypothetical protein
MRKNMGYLKEHFFEAINSGKLGRITDRGIEFTLKEFKQVFSYIETDYINSFLPAATLEPGMKTMTHTKFLFRINKGSYLLHPDALDM